MSSINRQFGRLMLALSASGESLRLQRSKQEVTLLAFDTQIKRMVELHLLHRGQPLEPEPLKLALRRADIAKRFKGHSFTQILDFGEDDSVAYYTSNLSDGEYVQDYVERRGALAPAMTFSLLLQLMEDLVSLGEEHPLLPYFRLDRVMMTTQEDTFLQLRLADYGLGEPVIEPVHVGRQVTQLCELIFCLLTGRTYAGENPDRYPALTALPMGLRTTLRSSLVDSENAPLSMQKLRDDVREAYAAQVSSIQARNSRKSLVITASTQPLSHLQDFLLEGVPLQWVLGDRFRIADDDQGRKFPFAIPCISAKNDQPVMVHLLPPSRIVDKTLYETVPLQSWKFTPEKHPNILRSLSLWESPEWSFLTEERETGFPLSRLLTERISLNPAEVLLVLKQVSAGLVQGAECGVGMMDIHPSNLFLCVGKPGPMLAREHEKLMQKRLDVWPAFVLKLRPHVTMRNLYETPLAELVPNSENTVSSVDQENRNRSLVALAAFLLAGKRVSHDNAQFPESVPEALSAFIRETLDSTRLRGQTLPQKEFLERYEKIISGQPEGDFASRLRGSLIPIEEMESAGTISDFDEEFSPQEETTESISRSLHAHEYRTVKRSSSTPKLFWVAVAAVLLLGAFIWWLLSPSPADTQATKSTEPSTPEKPVAQSTTTPGETKPTKPSPLPKAANSAPSSSTAPDKKATASSSSPASGPASSESSKPAEPAPERPPGSVPNPVIIRKAILPTPEELAKFKQGQIKQSSPPLPAQVKETLPGNSAPKTLGQPALMPLPVSPASELPEPIKTTSTQ